MWINSTLIILCLLQATLTTQITAEKRQRRYLLFTPATQWGIFVEFTYIRCVPVESRISFGNIPNASHNSEYYIDNNYVCNDHLYKEILLNIAQVFATVSIPLHPVSLVSVAWFFEANYYNVDNATYFEPLLSDIGAPNIRHLRSVKDRRPILTRRSLYIFIEEMLERHGYPGLCLLRAICENASQFLHNGVLGDLLHLILTPTSSMPEDDIEDSYYEAEYWGLENKCDDYASLCPSNPIDRISMIL